MCDSLSREREKPGSNGPTRFVGFRRPPGASRGRRAETARGGLVGERNFEIFFLRNERHANVLARRSLTPARVGRPAGYLNRSGK